MAVEQAAALASKAAPVLGAIKKQMYAPLLAVLRTTSVSAFASLPKS